MKKFIDICQSCLVLFGMMLCGHYVDTLCGSLPIGAPDSLLRQWVIFSGQNIFAFILPSILAWKVCFKGNPFYEIGASSLPSLRMIGIAALIYFLGIPALNQIVYWNQEMHLPEMFSAFEEWCREMEDLAAQQTEGLLQTDLVWQMLINILVIGIMTGIGEEFFFRGGLQNMLIHCGVGHHVAIWTAAFVFSAMHFQFFGFVPRMLLGALFGYFYWWSGNIWVSALAHAVNNSIVILSEWLIGTGILSEDFDMLGVSEGSFPVLPLLSVMLMAAAIFEFKRRGWLPSNRKATTTISKSI